MPPYHRSVYTLPNFRGNLRINHQLAMPSLASTFFPDNPSLEKELARLFPGILNNKETSKLSAEEIMSDFRHNGRDFEYCPDLENPLPPTFTPGPSKKNKKLPLECVFCKNNGEEASYYKCHILRDADGIVRCPVLRAYTCPVCNANGDQAHTLKYCPKNKDKEFLPFNSLKSLRNSTGKRRVK